ncbi:hypothetical protein JJJ10_22180 [Klebsiella grimontii]|uniref:hypothetical protein n=1 Tax=Klebsiella grimontii TaxID=2058152 RepID=UPI000E352DE1|nr:hypothetical protein [Klebsiella grimontii]RFP41644.1 hypothetical protein DDJ34_20380 [Klebsiella oxytoca]MBZ6971729.1 hypothetical protein [Klebsiella grimontii]MBZ7826298.1 hypothetical protein [Klebsiella grimontii]MDM4405849.1 hypothetical protein [Klebsiella grimontii]QTP39124.1 hypothetical protein JJJ10_22180 [Klebsiella grimontii]
MIIPCGKLLTILSIGLLLTGCDSGTPECNSKEAKDLVVSIAHEQMQKGLNQLRNSQVSGLVPKGVENTQLSVIHVVTTTHKSSPDIYECAADLNMMLSGNTTSIPITYNIQKTDDGTQFIVNVFGL